MGKVLLVTLAIAVVIYLLIRLFQHRRAVRGRPRGPFPTQPPGPARPRVVAPDDDPDFLRGLDRKRNERGRKRDGNHDDDQTAG